MAAIAVHMAWLNTLPDVTRFVTVAGKTLAVSVTEEDSGILATHLDTGCWGYGETVEGAMHDIALMLENDREWYCTGEGSRMYLHGRMYDRRAAIQRVFAP